VPDKRIVLWRVAIEQSGQGRFVPGVPEDQIEAIEHLPGYARAGR
jgi:hypothetical protein